eukprot:4828336-Amphidinium_carterae.1
MAPEKVADHIDLQGDRVDTRAKVRTKANEEKGSTNGTPRARAKARANAKIKEKANEMNGRQKAARTQECNSRRAAALVSTLRGTAAAQIKLKINFNKSERNFQ